MCYECMWVMARRQKLGVNLTLENNVEGELRLYQLPVRNTDRQPCEDWWERERKRWGIDWAVKACWDLALFLSRLPYNKPTFIKIIPHPQAPPQQKVIIGFIWVSVVHTLPSSCFSTDPVAGIYDNTSQHKSISMPFRLYSATFINSRLSFIHVFENSCQ